MAGENNHPKSSSANTNTNKSSSSDHRKSRWQSSSSATPTTATATTTTNPPSSQTPSKKPPTNSNPNSTPPSRPSSNKPTPKHALNNNNNSTPTPSSQPPPFPFSPPPQPTYGFHMLDRRTIVLADGTVRSYFALPIDYQDFTPPPPRPHLGRFGPPHDLTGGPPDGPFGPGPMKRKFGFGDERDRERDGGSSNNNNNNNNNNTRDEFARQKQQVLQYGNAGPGVGTGTSSPFKREDEFRNNKYMRVAGGGGGFGGGSNNNYNNNNAGSRKVDPAVMKAFLNFVKVINENANQRKNYLENGKHGPLQCLACARSSKEFPDVHALIMHAYNSENADLRADHLGLHRAICVLMGWNYLRAPDNSRAYQLLPSEEAAAYQDDLIMWPPMVIINNTNTGKGKDGRMEGLGNKAMDSKLRDLGFSGGKSKSLYCRDGHLGITLIKFPSEQSGLKEAMRLADHFEKEHHGRRDWARVKYTANDRDEESNPNLVMVDQRTGERRRILYGYLATVSDLDKVDYETRKKVVIESKHEKLQPSK